MNPLLIGGAVKIANEIIDRFWPSEETKLEAKQKVLDSVQKGEATWLGFLGTMLQGQAATNTAEASGDDKYTKRWRPTIGYIIAAALGFHYIINPLLLWTLTLLQLPITPPAIGMDEHLWELIMGMLGLAGWRTLDKIRGKA